jgi:hypothetical protein
MPTPARPVIGGDNGHGGQNTQYDLNDWDKLYGSQGTVSNPNGQGTSIQVAGDANAQAGDAAGRNNASIYYGTSQDLGAASQDITSRLKSKLDQPSGLANQMMQTGNQAIDRANVKSGMSGLNTSGQSIASQRDAQTRSDAVQQSQNQINMSNYQKNIGAGISGTESLAAAGAGRGIASTPTPVPAQSNCSFCIVATQLFLNREITKIDLLKVMKAGRSFDKKTYIGYIILAQPFLNTKSKFLKKMIIPAFKTYADEKPNLFAKIMIFCSMITGRLYSATGSKLHLRLLQKATVNDMLMKRELYVR